MRVQEVCSVQAQPQGVGVPSEIYTRSGKHPPGNRRQPVVAQGNDHQENNNGKEKGAPRREEPSSPCVYGAASAGVGRRGSIRPQGARRHGKSRDSLQPAFHWKEGWKETPQTGQNACECKRRHQTRWSAKGGSFSRSLGPAASGNQGVGRSVRWRGGPSQDIGSSRKAAVAEAAIPASLLVRRERNPAVRKAAISL
jgi:hypothetical protein